MYEKIYSSGDISKAVYQNGIIWKKKYIWEKYKVIKGTKDVWSATKTPIDPPVLVSESVYRSGTRGTLYDRYDIVNGEITLKFPIYTNGSYINIGLIGTTKYSMVNNKPAEGKVVEDYRRSKGVSFTHYLSPKKEQIPTTEKGSYISEVVSYNKDEYPTNGEKDGYWYEKVN